MEKGKAGYWTVHAVYVSTSGGGAIGAGVTGDAANITADIYLGGSTSGAATTDINPSEIGKGYYEFSITSAEANTTKALLIPDSSTPTVEVRAIPPVIYPRPAEFNALGISSGGAITNVNLVDTCTTNTDLVSAASIADAVWDEASADHLVSGSTGELLQDIDDEVDVIHDTILDLAVTGAPLNTVVDGNTLTTGTETSGTYESTEFTNGVYHVITAVTNTIDIEYLATLPNSDAVPDTVSIDGYLKEGVPAGGDTIDLQVYNYVAAGWDTVMPALFTGITTDGPSTSTAHNLLARHVGTSGADDRKMRIRLYSATLEAGTTLNVDKINIGYAESISSSVTSILADTDELQTNQGDWLTATGFATPANVTASTSTIQVDIAALNDISAAEVNAEVDSALNTAIPASPTADSINEYIQHMKYVMVNKTTVTKLTGTSVILKDNDSDIYATVVGAYVEDPTTVVRLRLE